MLSDAYKRWRHTRGYGVHSPFAFRILNEVIRQPRGYEYYGYEEIDSAAHAAGRADRRMARMLLRLAAYLDLRSAFLADDSRREAFSTALRCACPGMRISSSAADTDRCRLICAPARELSPAVLGRLISTPGRVVLLTDVPDQLAITLFESLREGVMFRSRSAILLIAREGMQKIEYTVNF